MSLQRKITSHIVTEESFQHSAATAHTVRWYRSSYYNAVILGLCNFCAPGIWTAMNALGGGGEQSPWLVNAANALTCGCMIVTCAFSGVFVKYLGIRWTLIIGAAGYCPYTAGLYCNNRFGSAWFVLLGATCCGLGAGLFWMAEAAIALSYPESCNQGRFLSTWLTFRVAGQVLGGAINLGLNADRDEAGAVSYKVYQVFIALQACAPFVGLFVTAPKKVTRTDGVRVSCSIPRDQSLLAEFTETVRLFKSKHFLLVIPLIASSVYSDAVFFTFQGLWFTVRARALASFLSGLVAILGGHCLGIYLDSKRLSARARGPGSWLILVVLQGAWWIWGTVLVTEYRQTRPTLDWTSPGFARGFVWFLMMVMSFQMNYMYLYFVMGMLSKDDESVIRHSGLLRATEAAVQAVSYGLASIPVMGESGSLYLNFALWAVAIPPAWLVVRGFCADTISSEVEDGGCSR